MGLKALMVFPEFPYSFWSLPEYRGMAGGRALFPPLGLLTVAALLPREWEVRLVDLNVRPLSESDWAWADVVMLSAMHAQRRGLLEVIREARRRGKVTVAGGPYPSSHPDDVVEAGCDFVVCGEGEVTVPELVRGGGERVSGRGDRGPTAGPISPSLPSLVTSFSGWTTM